MPYDIKQNYRDCNGYAVVGPSGDVKGCHTTRSAAIQQQRAIYANENKVSKQDHELYSQLTPEEAAFHDALVEIVDKFGPFDQGTSGVWVGYETAQENEDAAIGVKCGNCSFHYEKPEGKLGCKILSFEVEENGKCRLAAIPDGYVNVGGTNMDDMNDDMNKRDYTARQRREMAGKGQAMPDGSFPIANRMDLKNAIQSVGRADNYDAAKAHIVRRAKALNAMDMLPEEWRSTKKMWGGMIDPRNAKDRTF